MKYKDLKQGIFISRRNRFISEVEVNGVTEECHMNNTGRCEVLEKGLPVWLKPSDSPLRKTKYDLITVKTAKGFVNLDSLAPNKVFGEWAAEGHFIPDVTLIKPETVYGKSRFDFYIEAPGRRIFTEVKGVTMEKDGVALFPDAPTERGAKHLGELVECQKAGFEAWAVFVIAMPWLSDFAPNTERDPRFAKAFFEAKNKGVNILPLFCDVTEDEIKVRES